MSRIASLFAIALLTAGCSRSTPPAATPPVTLPQAAQAAPATQISGDTPKAVELRHFYLLSPGPSSKLVVTRSDVPPPPER